MAKRKALAPGWLFPILVAVVTLAALTIAKRELSEAAAIGFAVALLLYVAAVTFMRRRKIH